MTGQGSEQPSLALETALLGLQLHIFRGPFQLNFFIASLIVRTVLLLLHECTVPNSWDLSPCSDSIAVGTTMLSELETACNVQYRMGGEWWLSQHEPPLPAQTEAVTDLVLIKVQYNSEEALPSAKVSIESL